MGQTGENILLDQTNVYLLLSIIKRRKNTCVEIGVSRIADKKRGRQDMLEIIYITMKNYNKRNKNVVDTKKTKLV